MKTRQILASLLALSVMCCLATSVFAGKGGPQGNQTGAGLEALTPEEAATLSFMREEEKLARDVYTEMYKKWGAEIFSNIAASEQNHMDAIKVLLDKYGLDDPALGPGEFTVSSGLQGLYDKLIEKGQESLLDAFEVGVLIEEDDIKHLNEAMLQTKKTDLLAVYGNLLSGSLRHLEVFKLHVDALLAQ